MSGLDVLDKHERLCHTLWPWEDVVCCSFFICQFVEMHKKTNYCPGLKILLQSLVYTYAVLCTKRVENGFLHNLGIIAVILHAIHTQDIST